MANEKNLLVVEDNDSFYDAAQRALSNRANIMRARDYVEAGNIIESMNNQLYGAIVDCFFPQETGSGKRDLGRQTIEKIAGHYSRPQDQAREVIDEVSKYTEMDQELETFVTNWALCSNLYEPKRSLKESPILMSIQKVGSTVGKDAATTAAKNTLGMVYGPNTSFAKKAEEVAGRDFYGSLVSALEKDEANAPLGIEVGELLNSEGIPMNLATSTWHHDNHTQPIQDYCGRFDKGWTLVDTSDPGAKEKPNYWSGAMDSLENKIQEGIR